VPVGVEDAGILIVVDFVDFALDRLKELGMLDGRVGLEVLERFRPVGLILDVETQHCLCPLFELGHFLSGELVAIASDADDSIISKCEFCIFEPPAVVLEPLLLVADRFSALDLVAVDALCQVGEPVHDVYNYDNIGSQRISTIDQHNPSQKK
jgi:hypothetical protein